MISIHATPHCTAAALRPWGSSHGLPRYRCGDCRCTCNPLTGTSLARLRKSEQWLEYQSGSAAKQPAQLRLPACCLLKFSDTVQGCTSVTNTKFARAKKVSWSGLLFRASSIPLTGRQAPLWLASNRPQSPAVCPGVNCVEMGSSRCWPTVRSNRV